jgi:hypothetical protein
MAAVHADLPGAVLTEGDARCAACIDRLLGIAPARLGGGLPIADDRRRRALETNHHAAIIEGVRCIAVQRAVSVSAFQIDDIDLASAAVDDMTT